MFCVSMWCACYLGSVDGQVGPQTTTVGAYGCDGFDTGSDHNSSQVAGKLYVCHWSAVLLEINLVMLVTDHCFYRVLITVLHPAMCCLSPTALKASCLLMKSVISVAGCAWMDEFCQHRLRSWLRHLLCCWTWYVTATLFCANTNTYYNHCTARLECFCVWLITLQRRCYVILAVCLSVCPSVCLWAG